MHSHYFVSAVLSYKPECKVTIQKADILTYGKLTVNFFQWMPGVIGNWLLDVITRNAQDRIFATVEKSIQTNAETLTETYNPCLVFPSMGKMTPWYFVNQEIEDSETNSKLLGDPRYIGDLLGEISETEEKLEKCENTSTNGAEINTETISENMKTEL